MPPVAVILLLAAPALADRSAVEETLAAMERAVLAGDAAAYLDLVVPADGPDGDPVFRQEQVNWARDLQSEHGGAPAEFDLAIVDAPDRPAQFWPRRAEFEMVMTWRMPPAEAGGARPPRRRSVSFPVVFKNIDGRWLYAGENWIVFQGEGVTVRTVEGFEDVARRVVDLWPEVRSHVEAGFEIPPPGLPHQEVKIYGDMRHLQASIYLSYADPLSGWNEPGESIKIVGSHSSSPASLRPLLAHECGHVATFTFGPHAADAPWWLVEGVAELASEAFSPAVARLTDEVVRDWARSASLADWSDLTDFRTVSPRLSGHVYRQGHHMLAYVSTTYGRARRNAWLRAIAQGRTLDEATVEALGVTFADLDAAWRADLLASISAAGDDESTQKK